MDIPLWMWRYAEEITSNFDSSHDLYHLVNVYTYAKEIIQVDYPGVNIIEILTPKQSLEAVYHAAFCHDLVDDKYVNTEIEIEKLEQFFLSHGYSFDQWRAVKYLINNISYSKQKKPGFTAKPEYKLALDIVSDADKLDAYRPERVVAYQKFKSKDHIKEWTKTILVKRILNYRNGFLKTSHAMNLSLPMHEELEKYVEKNLSKVKMFDYK